MTKKKPPAKTQDPAAETETLELSDAQIYEQQVQLAIDDCTGESLKLLEAKFQALDLPDDGPNSSRTRRRSLEVTFATSSSDWRGAGTYHHPGHRRLRWPRLSRRIRAWIGPASTTPTGDASNDVTRLVSETPL